MSEDKTKKKENKPEDVPLGTGMADDAKKILLDRKKRQEKMNKRFGIKSKPKPNINN